MGQMFKLFKKSMLFKFLCQREYLCFPKSSNTYVKTIICYFSILSYIKILLKVKIMWRGDLND